MDHSLAYGDFWMAIYIDDRKWIYKVRQGLAPGIWKAYFHKPGRTMRIGWKCLKELPWRDSFADAQRDLDDLAKIRGWKQRT